MHARLIRRRLGVVAVFALLAACGSDPVEPEIELPAADGAELLSFLNDESYDSSWQLWPGRGTLYPGTDPHVMLLTTYVNDIASQGLAGSGNMPTGSIIVKENYLPDSTLVAVTTMYKVPGPNSDENDWFWLKNDGEGVIEVEGAVEDCVKCHAGAADFDYLWLRQQDAEE